MFLTAIKKPMRAAIPVIPRGVRLKLQRCWLAPTRPNHIVHLCSWGRVCLPPSCSSNAIGYKLTKVLLLNTFLLCSSNAAAQFSLQQAQQLASQFDPWLAGNLLQEQAMLAKSEAAATLADPVVSVAMLNVPSDGFSFKQEPMTQLKIGLSQQFARGESLALKKQQLRQQAGQYPYLRQDRQAQIKVVVAELWLSVFSTQQSLALIEQSRPLFMQLVDIATANYSSAQGSTRQQDIVNAQVELARLDDRLAALTSQRDTNLARLSQWLYQSDQSNTQWLELEPEMFPQNWPELPHIDPAIDTLLKQQDRQGLAQLLLQHPAILAIEQKIKSSGTAVQLAKQQYQPQWGLNASYAYRDDDLAGNSRADFFSVGLSLDLPIFTAQKQDQDLAAARMQAESGKTDKLLALRSMLSQLQSTWHTFTSLSQRISHYQQQILTQMKQQSDATLSAYTTDDGNFSEVMRAKIAQLNTDLEFIQLQNKQAISLTQLHYYFNPQTQQDQSGQTKTHTLGVQP